MFRNFSKLIIVEKLSVLMWFSTPSEEALYFNSFFFYSKCARDWYSIFSTVQ